MTDAEYEKMRERVRQALALVERDWMRGDNLAVTFCTEIETWLGADQDPGSDTGWAEEVSEECDATLNAMVDAVIKLVKQAVAAERDRLTKPASPEAVAWAKAESARIATEHEAKIRADERERLSARLSAHGRTVDDRGWCEAIAEAIVTDWSALNKAQAR